MTPNEKEDPNKENDRVLMVVEITAGW